MSPAERRAIADDEDLISYFDAFPEQAVVADATGLVSFHILHFSKTFADTPSRSQQKRQVATCSTKPVPTATATATGTKPPPTATSTPPPPSPRQRNEFLTWPGAAAGTTWKYTWKSYQTRSSSTTPNFFHAWQ